MKKDRERAKPKRVCENPECRAIFEPQRKDKRCCSRVCQVVAWKIRNGVRRFKPARKSFPKPFQSLHEEAGAWDEDSRTERKLGAEYDSRSLREFVALSVKDQVRAVDRLRKRLRIRKAEYEGERRVAWLEHRSWVLDEYKGEDRLRNWMCFNVTSKHGSERAVRDVIEELERELPYRGIVYFEGGRHRPNTLGDTKHFHAHGFMLVPESGTELHVRISMEAVLGRCGFNLVELVKDPGLWGRYISKDQFLTIDGEDWRPLN